MPPFADEKLSPLAKELATNPKYRLFDILFNSLPESHAEMLKTQYRMIRNIGDFTSTTFYDEKINTGIDDKKRKHGIPIYENYSVIWYDTSKLEAKGNSKQNGGPYINTDENSIIKNILNELNSLPNAKDIDIGIITGYRAQKDLIRKTVNNGDFNNIKKIDVNTLDAFQGRENDIIIYSTVRVEKSIGFKKKKKELMLLFQEEENY